tara:strand:+ start:299 stop:874 length:576 start_codon:yes stop_codon:yes gene_type:complete
MKKYCIVIFLIFINFIFSQNNEEPDYIPAPDFTLSLFNSKSVLSEDSSITLSSLTGNVVLLNFWATWCGPCIAEIPEFNDLYNKYKMEGLEILGVSVSDNYRQLEKFTKKIDVQYKLLFGTTDNMSSVMQDYGNVYSVPISFLINREGLVVRGYPGAILGEYWSSLLKDDILKFLAIPYSNNSLDTIKVID